MSETACCWCERVIAGPIIGIEGGDEVKSLICKACFYEVFDEGDKMDISEIYAAIQVKSGKFLTRPYLQRKMYKEGFYSDNFIDKTQRLKLGGVMYNTQDISNHLEISQLLHRYGKALDEKKYNLLKSVFTMDAELVYLLGEQLIKLPMSESDNLFKKFLTKCYWTSHLISNPVLDIRGDTAESRSHVTATHIQVKEDGTQNIWIVSGAYEDKLVRRSEGWRIKKRIANAPYVEGAFLMEGVREYATYPSVDETGRNNKIG